MRRVLALLPVLLIACGSHAPPPPAASGAPAAPAPSAAASDSEMHHHDHEAPRPPTPMSSITVTLDGRSVDVELAKVASGAASAPLMAVWKQAFPNEDLAGVGFDLVGSDGFRPTSRPDCSHLLSVKEIEGAKVDAASHDVSWDASAKMAHCYNVKALSRLEAKR